MLLFQGLLLRRIQRVDPLLKTCRQMIQTTSLSALGVFAVTQSAFISSLVSLKILDGSLKIRKVDLTRRYASLTMGQGTPESSDQQTKPRVCMTRPPQHLLGHDGECYFHVEKLSGHRRRGGRQEFLVKWRGYPEVHNTWKPEGRLVEDCADLVVTYKRSHSIGSR